MILSGPGKIDPLGLGKAWPAREYENGHQQNRAKIRQTYQTSYFLYIVHLFLRILMVAVFSYPVGGANSLPKIGVAIPLWHYGFSEHRKLL